MNIEAVCLLILDQPDESIQLHYKILKLREELNDTDAISETLLNIGNIFYRGQDKEQALYFYTKSLKLALQKNNIKLLSSLYNNLANCYKDSYYENKKNIDKNLAIKYSEIAITYKEKLKTDQTIENAYLTLARLYYDAKDFKRSENYAIKGENLSIINKNDESVGSSKILLSELAIENKEYIKAQKKLDELYAYSTENKAFHILNTYDEEIFTLRNIIRNLNSSNSELNDSLNTTDVNTLLLARQKVREELKVKYDTEKKELDNNNLILINKIEKNKADKNRIISIISVLFAAVLLALIIKLIKKNKSIHESKTEIQKQSIQLLEQNIQLQRSQAFKAKLFSIISHDLKSPLNNLKSIVELSANVTLDLEQQSFIMTEINQELNVTSNLLNDLLFWSKTQMKTDSIAWTWFNINSIIESCICTLQSNIKQKQLLIKKEVQDNLIIWGDENRCEFVIRNILHNAIKYSSIRQEIEIGILEEENCWKLYIKDYGVGISSDKVQTILTENNKTMSTKGTQNEQGAGIGLLLCNDFAQSLNWSLIVESEINYGTVFYINIKKTEPELTQIKNYNINSTSKIVLEPEYSNI